MFVSDIFSSSTDIIHNFPSRSLLSLTARVRRGRRIIFDCIPDVKPQNSSAFRLWQQLHVQLNLAPHLSALKKKSTTLSPLIIHQQLLLPAAVGRNE
jgi:hypothetical protein